ncbi:hypothetical protein FRC96_06625 [Lujinxingia vulgaris]|uniref:Uncharacterized protein n=1 Tax=Lujinxingia vulgaris TaxID=2600176 RepID=A0A5C6XJA8_9DELT|nr:hypothetical protein [Lujinxingia vulgaris]TXD39692.1 hypothetical protein FRC96_06625 [Lujinxingia vulgaris]
MMVMPEATLEHELTILLEARERLPALADRLSAGTLKLSPSRCDQLSGWYASLRDDPGWPILEAALRSVSAWPRAWELAREAGFSARTSHHNALIFSEIVFDALKRDDLSLAGHVWGEALQAWVNADEGWLEDYLQHCLPTASAEAIRATRRAAPGPALEALEQRARRALNLDALTASPDRRGLRFAQHALDCCDRVFGEASSELAEGGAELTHTLRQTLASELTEALHTHIQAINLTHADAAELVAPLEGFEQRVRILSGLPGCDLAALRAGLNILWELRRLERDEAMEAPEHLLPALKPFADRLESIARKDHIEAAGPLADFHTFEAEIAFSLDTREAHLRRALTTCEGHRNASRMLSYLMLERANRDLLKLAATPELGAAIGAVRRRIESALQRAEDALHEARELYPANELLADYQRDLLEERARFNVQGAPRE